MEHTGSQVPSEINISTSPRSPSFLDRVFRRSSGSHAASSRIPTLNFPTDEVPSSNNTLDNTSSRPQSRSSSSSRSSHKRAPPPLMIDTSLASAKKSKTTYLAVSGEERRVRSSSRSRSRSRTERSPSPNIQIINRETSRVASINHVGRHTNDWLFGGFHLTSKIGAPRGRSK
ncbi:hypothetical protein TWF481_005135 [Arthrobotrys musiformis]|uniref:Uncharacterized protein n=1 Tax=Arthrobotrys musiformis TaxID=47236 RepID=A0AAV9WE24_9PEZI